MSESWRTPTVLQLCEAMREAGDYAAAPILADALQDADFPDAGRLALLRSSDLAPWEAERLVAQVYSKATAAAVDELDRLAAEMGPAGYPSGSAEEMTYAGLVNVARTYARTGDDGLGDGSMNWSNYFGSDEIEAFWAAVAKVTGMVPPEYPYNIFSCSC